MKIGQYENFGSALMELRTSVEQAAQTNEIADDPRRRIQFRALAEQLAGAISMVEIIDGRGRSNSQDA